MMFAVRNRIRRLAAAAAVVVTVVATMVTAAGQASADSAWGPVYLVNEATDQCLATDFSGSVTSWSGCDGPQRWEFLDISPGWLIKNEATGRCLMQLNWTTVISAACNSSMAEFHWHFTNNYIWSANTGGYLVTDFSGSVYLHNPTFPVNQRWFYF